MQRVINFSGGRTSAYMTITEYHPGDIVIFCDTGREHPKTYKFINDFEAFEKIPIHRISYHNSATPYDAFLQQKNYKRLPNRTKRICTVELKIDTQKRYLRSLGIQTFENLIGFRADEQSRVLNRAGNVKRFKKVFDKFPLYEKGINKAMVLDYWKTKPYNLEIPSILGNCTLCFMKGQSAIISILASFPELAEPWIRDETESAKLGLKTKRGPGGRTYFPGVTMQQLLNVAKNNLFKDYDLNEIQPAFNCACTT